MTDGEFTGKMVNTLDGADQICGGVAKQWMLQGQYRAWISGFRSDYNAAARMANSPLVGHRLIRLDGVEVAGSWAEFVGGWWDENLQAYTGKKLAYPIVVTASKLLLSEMSIPVWTGARPDGRNATKLEAEIDGLTYHGDLCYLPGGIKSWTEDLPILNGHQGNAAAVDFSWSDAGLSPCDQKRRLICIQYDSSPG